MNNKLKKEEIGFVRPDALREELTSVKIIGGSESGRMSKVDVIKVVNPETKNEDFVCPSYITQYYG